MGRLNNFSLDALGLELLISRFEQMDKDVDAALTKGLKEVAEKAARDTEAALAPKYLPAHGKYSRAPSKTAESISRNYQVQKDGLSYYVNIGFDFAKDGAGGFLIKGTPRMEPDPMLHRMYYKGSKFIADLYKALWYAVAESLYK